MFLGNVAGRQHNCIINTRPLLTQWLKTTTGLVQLRRIDGTSPFP